MPIARLPGDLGTQKEAAKKIAEQMAKEAAKKKAGGQVGGGAAQKAGGKIDEALPKRLVLEQEKQVQASLVYDKKA